MNEQHVSRTGARGTYAADQLLGGVRSSEQLDQKSERLKILPGLRLDGNYMEGVSVRESVFQGQRLASKNAGALLTAGEDEPLDIYIERLQVHINQQCP